MLERKIRGADLGSVVRVGGSSAGDGCGERFACSIPHQYPPFSPPSFVPTSSSTAIRLQLRKPDTRERRDSRPTARCCRWAMLRCRHLVTPHGASNRRLLPRAPAIAELNNTVLNRGMHHG